MTIPFWLDDLVRPDATRVRPQGFRAPRPTMTIGAQPTRGESQYPVPEQSTLEQALGMVASIAPGTGEVMSAADAGKQLSKGNVGSAALAAAGAIPLFGKGVRVARGMTKEAVADAVPLAAKLRAARREAAPPDEWFHGTSTDQGLGVGDFLDPAKNQFGERTAWATASRKHADSFAYAKSAISESGGKPKTYRIEIPRDARIARVKELLSEEDLLALQKGGYDGVIIERGEAGVPMLGLFRGGLGKVRHVARRDLP